MKERDIEILKVVLEHINEIEYDIQEFNVTGDRFLDNKTVSRSIIFLITQIGEIIGRLSDDVKNECNNIISIDIKRMRNRIIHGYGTVNLKFVWKTVENEIPKLKAYCEFALDRLQSNGP
jgi:uncharacterized protein with HEPN domain